MPGLKTYPRTWADNITITAADLDDSTRADIIMVNVSFEAGGQGTHKVYLPYACTVTSWRVFVTKALAATDAGTITLQNSAGVNMTASAVATVPSSSAYGTELNQTGTVANNAIAAGSYAQLVTAKATAGGRAQVQLFVRRS